MLCDRIAIIDKGRAVFVGTLKELKDKYDKKDLEKLFMVVINHELFLVFSKSIS